MNEVLNVMSENEKKNREELFKIMREHPELPVIPFVDGEIPPEDTGYWQGSWGRAEVDEYVIAERAERFLFRSDDDGFDALRVYMSWDDFDKLPEDEETCRREYYDKLPWNKAIIVYINSP